MSILFRFWIQEVIETFSAGIVFSDPTYFVSFGCLQLRVTICCPLRIIWNFGRFVRSETESWKSYHEQEVQEQTIESANA